MPRCASTSPNVVTSNRQPVTRPPNLMRSVLFKILSGPCLARAAVVSTECRLYRLGTAGGKKKSDGANGSFEPLTSVKGQVFTASPKFADIVRASPAIPVRGTSAQKYGYGEPHKLAVVLR